MSGTEVVLLVVMRVEDMHVRHPDQIETEVCSVCAAPVAVYPSGQSIMREQGRLRVKLVCNACVEPFTLLRTKLAPGAREEKAESVPVKGKQ
jgi:RNase P subunit RPR2